MIVSSNPLQILSQNNHEVDIYINQLKICIDDWKLMPKIQKSDISQSDSKIVTGQLFGCVVK